MFMVPILSRIVRQTSGSSEQVGAAFAFQNPRSGCKHNAWGGAERNPRMTKQENQAREACDSAQATITHNEWLSPTSRALPRSSTPLGFRSAPPRLYAVAALRGL